MKKIFFGFLAFDLVVFLFVNNLGPFFVPVGPAVFRVGLPWQSSFKTSPLDAPSAVLSVNQGSMPSGFFDPAPRPNEVQIVGVNPSSPSPASSPARPGYYVAPGIYKCTSLKGGVTLQDRPCDQ